MVDAQGIDSSLVEPQLAHQLHVAGLAERVIVYGLAQQVDGMVVRTKGRFEVRRALERLQEGLLKARDLSRSPVVIAKVGHEALVSQRKRAAVLPECIVHLSQFDENNRARAASHVLGR